MNVRGHILGELVALLAGEANVETLPDDRVEQLAEAACAKYKFRPSRNLARRICMKAAEEIKRRRR